MNDKIEKVIYSSPEFNTLCQELERGKLAKTIMLICQDSIYSFEFATLLSSAIFENGRAKTEHYLKVKSLSHPDLKIYPVKEKLLVSDSEEIVFESAVKPIFADKKVFIIRDFEQSTEQAQNKLLKTLEEPQENVYFILTTSNLRLIFPTIRSRCNKIVLGKLKDEQVKSYLEFDSNKDLISSLADGYIGRAQGLANMENLKGNFENVLSLITQLKSSKEIVKYVKIINSFQDKIDFLLSCLAQIFEDLISLKAGKEIRLKMYEDILEKTSEEYSITALVETQKLLDKAAEELKYNCNFNVVMENLLLSILEVKYLCK